MQHYSALNGKTCPLIATLRVDQRKLSDVIRDTAHGGISELSVGVLIDQRKLIISLLDVLPHNKKASSLSSNISAKLVTHTP